jgi:uncharacterized protein
MRQHLPKEIDPFRFAHNGRELEGTVDVADLSRLAGALKNTSGQVNISMRFDIDATGTPFMQGHFETTLSLICERCMGELSYPLVIDTQLGLVKNETMISRLAEQYEPWLIEDNEQVDPVSIVEDELILALPLVPKHDYNCLPEEVWFSGDKEEIEAEPDKPASPFAVLSALKTKK